MSTPKRPRNVLARRRARLRKESAGATMFIVATTLGSLAVMGVFGLAATTADVRAAGHGREGMQSRHIAEHALMDTGAMIGPVTAQHVLRTMFGGVGQQTTTCKTANTYNAASRLHCAAEACMLVTPEEIDRIVKAAYPTFVTNPYFTSKSFGPSTPTPHPLDARIRVELTNPIEMDQAGTDNLTGNRYVQVTATVFAELKSIGGPLTPPETMVVGRGRLTLGPVPLPSCNR